MWFRSFVMAVAAAVVALPALAGQCPKDVAAIDNALAANTTLSAEQRAEVEALRNKGEALHNEGKHTESVETLAQAKEMLGIQ